MKRREFIAAGAALAATSLLPETPAWARGRTLRLGLIGTGMRGQVLLKELVRRDDVEVVALCDIEPIMLKRGMDMVAKAGRKAPTAYGQDGDRNAWKRLLEQRGLDGVIIATPWEYHAPMAIAAMQARIAVGCEVVAGITLDDHWQVLRTQLKTGTPYMLLENVCYRRDVLAVLNMVRQGLFGEILHAEGGYLHDLRSIKFADEGEGLWRRAWATKLNGNLYPTHGLGPIANCLDINRGDRFDHLVSMSGPSRGLQDWAASHYPEDHPKRKERYVLGDMNTSIIKTANGKTILVEHCTNLPRPYSRIHMVQGTKGLFQGYPNRFYVEGRGKNDQWQEASAGLAEFEHPLWKEIAAQAQGAGHGGMDFIEDYRLVKCLREGTPTDMNVYDAAALSAVVHLSVQSVGKKSAPIDFPDFTRGRWKTTAPLEIVHM